MGLLHALDKEICVAVERFVANGVEPTVDSLYQSIQRSNSSLKRRPRKVLEASLERVLDYLNLHKEEPDSEAEIERQVTPDTQQDRMNRSLRANLAPQAAVLSNSISSTSEEPPKKRRSNGESLPKRQKTIATYSDHSLADIGGMPEVLDQLGELVIPLLAPEEYLNMGLSLPRGVLLHGPPGCGKTTVSKVFATQLGLPLVQILGPSIVSGMSGESEKAIRERFDEAKKIAPCLLFIDEIDAIAPKRETSQGGMEKRIVAQLLISMDELEGDPNKPVIVLAATNRPDSLDAALRRGGRFDTEIMIGVPNEGVRASILAAQTRKLRLASDVDIRSLAKSTAGFVGADLKDLVGKAGAWQMRALKAAFVKQGAELGTANIGNEALPELGQLIARLQQKKNLPRPAGFENTAITMQAFLSVLPTITPSSKREGFATVPDVSWADVGALQAVRRELEMAIVQPIVNPERFIEIGLDAPTGVLLWGPPGCGKTLLAKAVAAESKANFISIKGPELLDKYVGESEAAVRRVFSRARSSAPCIIFFDELDALAPRRDGSAAESSARVVNMLLTELDGLHDRGGIFVIGATNRPDIIDEAMLRPGRLETPLFVDLPGPQERVEILQTLLRQKNVPQELADIARTSACDGFTGADLRSLWTKAAQHALEHGARLVTAEDLAYATTIVKGSVRDMEKYYRMRNRFAK
ncbi:hypothetical protein AMS68_007719 [Peltaster fructicola]|uniref:AAA+ ATPase domain-containing protein n=1 Tax=Peltaster fructicola TaxID=286661 RepID=A0A6H0Y588_9PEZI|nr:hypothetical protein AMS68_007719 [Peltaster fructicola]